MTASAQRKAEIHFRQLCSLGIESTVIMPALFRCLREMVPYSYCGFYWADERGRLANYYWEGDGEHTALDYLLEFHGNPAEQRKIIMGLPEALATLPTVNPAERLLRISRGAFERHDYYNLCWRPARMYDSRFVMVREGSRGLGALLVSRARNQISFTPHEEQLLERLAPFLAQTCAATTPFTGPWQDTEDTGLVVLKACGEIQHMSPSARALLTYASHATLAARTAGTPHDREDFDVAIKRLCRNLVATFREQGDARPVTRAVRNTWGAFMLRAYWLDPNRQDDGDLVGVVVQRREPWPVKLLDRLQHKPLSPRQREICLALAEEKSYASIAEKLGLQERTVISHVQHIHARLETRNRTELMRKLLVGD